MPLPSDLPQLAFQYLHSPYGTPVSALDIPHSHRLQAALPTVASQLLELQVLYGIDSQMRMIVSSTEPRPCLHRLAGNVAAWS